MSIFNLIRPPCALTTSVCVFSRTCTRSAVSARTVTGICSITRSLRRRLAGSVEGTRFSLKRGRSLQVLGKDQTLRTGGLPRSLSCGGAAGPAHLARVDDQLGACLLV